MQEHLQIAMTTEAGLHPAEAYLTTELHRAMAILAILCSTIYSCVPSPEYVTSERVNAGETSQPR
nr:hypothetical protein Iba_chr02fCG4720 [Ipomoea batatas]